MKNMLTTLSLALTAITITSSISPAIAAEKLIATTAGSDVDIPSTGATRTATFAGVSENATGFGITAQWTAVNADTDDGFFPWSVDLEVAITPPSGPAVTWGPTIFGGITFADFPMQTGKQLLPGTTASGDYVLNFDSGAPSPWIAGLRDVQYHLTATVADVMFARTATPDTELTWDRPFFIAGVSGLGPVAYDAFEFTVETSGVYEFSSVLMPTNNHMTFLYRDAFDPTLPLTNLFDYGLGNGSSVFGIPEGSSVFSTMLFEGQTYTWVTSQWAFFSTISPSDNTIVGPGTVIPAGTGICAGDCDDSGTVDFNDLVSMLFEFGNTDSGACDADGSGTIDFNDLVTALFVFGPCG